jgi:hypothetical protein
MIELALSMTVVPTGSSADSMLVNFVLSSQGLKQADRSPMVKL